jgi:putative DNA primase/helicase
MRITYWLQDYLGAEDTEENREIARMWLVSAVARVFEPGCQADHILVLEGPQGIGKSSALRILANGWYQGGLSDLRNKDSMQDLQGSWIIELGELDALRGMAATRIKDFITRTVDIYRPPYGRYPITRPRQCVFAGTTNDADYLRDATGARRFWPVAVKGLKLKEFKENVHDLWAEALAEYRAGTQWWPTPAQAKALAGIQEQRFEVDLWEEEISRFISNRIPPIDMKAILDHMEIPVERWTRGVHCRVGHVMKRLNWKKKRETQDGQRIHRYYPKDSVS